MLYCYNTEGNRNSVVSQALCKMDVTQLEHEMSKFKHGESGGIQCLPRCWQWTVDTLAYYSKGL